MFALTGLIILLCSLRLVLADNTIHNVTELPTTEAITADLRLLDEIQADMSKFVKSAETVYTKHFLDNHIGTADLELNVNLTMGMHVVHDYLTKITRSDFDLDMSACAFAPFVINLCAEDSPRTGPFGTVLKAEVLRARRCASTISRVHKQMTELRDSYFNGTSHILLLPVDFQPTVPYTTRLTQQENLAQSHELKMRFLGLWKDLLGLSELTLHLPNRERSEYLQRLEALHLEAGRNASVAASLDTIGRPWTVSGRRSVKGHVARWSRLTTLPPPLGRHLLKTSRCSG